MKRVVLASCDAKFYPHACMMLESVLRTSGDVIDEIVFFDLGLTSDQRSAMTHFDRVRIVDYPAWLTTELYADYLQPRMFAWKTYVLWQAAALGDATLYMDCGCVALNSLRPIFECIDRDEAFFIQDVHRNSTRTHEECFSIMQATEAERTALQIDAGIIGCLTRGRFRRIFSEGFEYARNRACIFGDAATHRHDQSIYSILAARHHLTPLHPYGPLVHWQGIQSREQIIWQHRGKWPALQRLRDRANALPPNQRIALYGAGQHSTRFLPTLRNLLEPRHQLIGILDDHPTSSTLDNLPVLPTSQYTSLSPTLILISSDAHEPAMLEHARQHFTGPEIWGIYTTNELTK